MQACYHGAGTLCLFFLGLDSDPSGPLVATATAGLGERSSFLPRAAMTASVGGREGRREENTIIVYEDVCVFSLLALMPLATNGGLQWEATEPASKQLTKPSKLWELLKASGKHTICPLHLGPLISESQAEA